MKKKLLFLVNVVVILMSSISVAAPIPSEIKSVVYFIFVPTEKGLMANGTGFLVGIENKEKKVTHGYLVTAKHVLLEEDKKTYYPYVFVRLNKKGGGAEMIRLDLIPQGEEKNVFIHHDKSVDIAVIPGVPSLEIYDYKFLPEVFMTTKDEFKNLRIREGSDIFFTGLFSPQFGKKITDQKNYPIVRFGKIALITDERINWLDLNADLYLVESASYGGNSGSPVYFISEIVTEEGNIHIGPRMIKLIGVMLGSFAEGKPLKTIQRENISVAESNIGISYVAPAYKLYDILFSDELKKQRGF